MTPTNKNKTISDILEEFWDKRGRHSKLPMYPKIESIAEATQAIEALITEAELKGFDMAFDCHDYDRLRKHKETLIAKLKENK